MSRRAAGAAALTACLVLTGATVPAVAGAAGGGVRLVRVGTFSLPVHVTAPPADRRRLFVVEQGGRIRVLRDGRKLGAPFLDIRSRVSVSNEQGLLSMAFAPDYASSGRFYVHYTDTTGDVRVDEFRRSAASADRASASSRRTVLRQNHRAFPNHNGGQLAFGPDRYLYIGIGDGGASNDPLGSGQRLDTLLGKILRIDPRRRGARPYTVPPGNPFVGRAGARPEIYAYGLRNPWRFSFDRANGALTIADVGESAFEEVNHMPFRRGSGANFGWRVFEGATSLLGGTAPGHDPPVLVKSHADGYSSIIGGFVVRDPALGSLQGRYVYTDLAQSALHSVVLSAGGAADDRPLGVSVGFPTSFGEDARGRIHVASGSGGVYRLAAS